MGWPREFDDFRFCAGFWMPAVTKDPRAQLASVQKAPRHEVAGDVRSALTDLCRHKPQALALAKFTTMRAFRRVLMAQLENLNIHLESLERVQVRVSRSSCAGARSIDRVGLPVHHAVPINAPRRPHHHKLQCNLQRWSLLGDKADASLRQGRLAQSRMTHFGHGAQTTVATTSWSELVSWGFAGCW
jgi:hypothetical protein